MISKRFPGWQARGDAQEVPREHELLTSPKLTNFPTSEVTLRPSMEERVYVLNLLNEGIRFALDCQKSVWEFAIEIQDLIARGISHSLMRWLVCQELVEHRIESETPKATQRQFFEAPSLEFNEKSRFVLSAKGRETFAVLHKRNKTMISQTFNRPDHALMNDTPPETPTWCPTTRILKFKGRVVKHFKWPAPNQEKLIATFHELGWPTQVDDPLPQTNVCPKQRLHDTIKNLNKQEPRLLTFRGDGTGTAARWEIHCEESTEVV